MIDSPNAMRSLLKLFGQRLKSLRKESGLSVAEVAAAVECDVSSIYSMERGRHAPSFKRLASLAELLKVDELDLLTFPQDHARHELVELSRGVPAPTVAAMKAACQRVLEEERRLKTPRKAPK